LGKNGNALEKVIGADVTVSDFTVTPTITPTTTITQTPTVSATPTPTPSLTPTQPEGLNDFQLWAWEYLTERFDRIPLFFQWIFK
jgi:hypothetical protein